MAIIRERIPLPGKLGKIFDIRLGLPRDRGFDPVKEARRYKDQAANPDTRINRFRGMISSAEGLARPNRFIAVVNVPRPLYNNIGASDGFAEYTTQLEATSQLNNVIRERLFFFCDSAQLPARSIADESKDQLYGPERKVARGQTWEDITLTFYMDQQMAEKMLFESWQNLAISPTSFNANYYDEYVGSIELYPLVGLRQEAAGGDSWKFEKGTDDRKMTKKVFDMVTGRKPVVAERKPLGPAAVATVGTYFNYLTEAFPKTIAMQELNYATTNALLKLSVTFTYRQALGPADLVDDNRKIAYKMGEHELRTKETSLGNPAARGRFSGIIDIAKGIGRDVLNQVKTKFPWGRIFGGKVIPPFF